MTSDDELPFWLLVLDASPSATPAVLLDDDEAVRSKDRILSAFFWLAVRLGAR
jgi:hypothetical protein